MLNYLFLYISDSFWLHIRVFGDWTRKLRDACEQKMEQAKLNGKTPMGIENSMMTSRQEVFSEEKKNETVIELEEIPNNGSLNGQNFDHLRRKSPTITNKEIHLFEVSDYLNTR